MSPLIRALLSWEGRSGIERGLKFRGLCVPDIYQTHVAEYCKARSTDAAESLALYWDEIAKERVFSAGKADSNLRTFRTPSVYKSRYLDDLARGFNYRASPFADPPIQPCLHAWTMALDQDFTLWNALRSGLTEQKMKEICHLRISAEGWTGKKRDVKPILQRYLEGQGFAEERLLQRDAGQPAKAFCKETQTGLVYQCWVDTGGLPDVIKLPLEFCVTHKNDPGQPFWIGEFVGIVPGFEFYGNCAEEPPECCVLGIYAFAQAVDLFMQSLEHQSATAEQ